MKKRKLTVLLAVAVLIIMMVAVPLTVNADESEELYQFAVHIFAVDQGYTVPTGRNKIAGYNKYYVSVSQNATGYPTNFIVIASNGVQITNNIVIWEDNSDIGTYYSAQHEGLVYLRANSASENVGYHIRGVWTPNLYQ